MNVHKTGNADNHVVICSAIPKFMNREHKIVILVLQTHFGKENGETEESEVGEVSEESDGDKAELASYRALTGWADKAKKGAR